MQQKCGRRINPLSLSVVVLSQMHIRVRCSFQSRNRCDKNHFLIGEAALPSSPSTIREILALGSFTFIGAEMIGKRALLEFFEGHAVAPRRRNENYGWRSHPSPSCDCGPDLRLRFLFGLDSFRQAPSNPPARKRTFINLFRETCSMCSSRRRRQCPADRAFLGRHVPQRLGCRDRRSSLRSHSKLSSPRPLPAFYGVFICDTPFHGLTVSAAPQLGYRQK